MARKPGASLKKTVGQGSGGSPRDPARSSGATGQKIRLRDRLRGYLLNHRQVCMLTLQRLLKEPLQTLMTALVIAIALGLPAGLYVGVSNLQQLGDGFDSTARLTLFLSRNARVEAINRLRETLEKFPDIAEVEYVSREQALAEFKITSGFGEALAMLDENPLPPVLLIEPASGIQGDTVAVNALVERLKGQALVDDVQLDMKWIQRLQGILEVFYRLTLTLGIMLALGILLVIGNTIRLAIENRRDEIVVVKLVGGTNGYVRRPFLYTGLWYGVFGGLLAWLLVTISLSWLAGSVANLASLYQSNFALTGLGFSGFVALPLMAGALGLLGAWQAVARHLAAIEPR